MCLAVPGKIIEVCGTDAKVDFQGSRREVSLVLTPEAGVGDWVLVHAGFAINTVTEADARETWGYLTAIAAANNELPGAQDES
jgi:hydrogenase expression/formation protein HypC